MGYDCLIFLLSTYSAGGKDWLQYRVCYPKMGVWNCIRIVSHLMSPRAKVVERGILTVDCPLILEVSFIKDMLVFRWAK